MQYIDSLHPKFIRFVSQRALVERRCVSMDLPVLCARYVTLELHSCAKKEMSTNKDE